MGDKTNEMLNEEGKAYGALIREYRRRRGLSQEQLGSVVGVKKNAVGAWESGRSRPDVASIPALCRELRLPLRVFFGVPESQEDLHLLQERFHLLNAYNRQVILRQMDLLLSLQETESESPRKPIPLRQSDLSVAEDPVPYLADLEKEDD